ncbi:MAG: DNA-binding response regulator [Hyphomicrobiales bacterium]|nr:MAG: DNA-binding response regulator [Hyphomicrobiales bacterium]
MNGTRVSIIEDDSDIAEILLSALGEHGFDAKHYPSASDFLNDRDSFKPTLCLIDLGLPDQNGLDLVKELDSDANISTIIISGRRGLSDKIVGLEMGADDYIEKPFETAELIARIRTVLRRTMRSQAREDTAKKERASFAGWTVDLPNYALHASDGSMMPLSQAEMEVLKIFLVAPNRLMSRAHILDALALDADKNYDRSIDVRISRLRNKLGEDSQNPKLIKTVYGAGYIFVADVSWE